MQIVSVNWSGEVERVQSHHGATRILSVPDDLPAMFPGRYGPPLGAFFGAGRGDILGICNADILMLKCDIAERARSRPATFFAARRLDVDRVGGNIVGLYRRGVDAVFFDCDRYRALIEDENLARFQLGAPFWDILLPLLASFHGPVSFIDPPFLVHPVHDARWSAQDYETLRQAAVVTVVRHAERHSATSSAARTFLQLFRRYVGRDIAPLDRRARRNAMALFSLWLGKLEREGVQRLDVQIGDELSPSAIARLRDPLPETPTDATSPSGGVGLRALRRWARARLREWKHQRRERAIAARLAGVRF